MNQKQLFEVIWNSRPHKSQVSGKPISEPQAINFAHLLSKGAYPRFKFREDNIWLMTAREHMLFDHQVHKIKDDPEWRHVFARVAELKREYFRCLAAEGNKRK